jgi:hypothetical protein
VICPPHRNHAAHVVRPVERASQRTGHRAVRQLHGVRGTHRPRDLRHHHGFLQPPAESRHARCRCSRHAPPLAPYPLAPRTTSRRKSPRPPSFSRTARRPAPRSAAVSCSTRSASTAALRGATSTTRSPRRSTRTHSRSRSRGSRCRAPRAQRWEPLGALDQEHEQRRGRGGRTRRGRLGRRRRRVSTSALLHEPRPPSRAKSEARCKASGCREAGAEDRLGSRAAAADLGS